MIMNQKGVFYTFDKSSVMLNLHWMDDYNTIAVLSMYGSYFYICGSDCKMVNFSKSNTQTLTLL